jgi:hypothetical protein
MDLDEIWLCITCIKICSATFLHSHWFSVFIKTLRSIKHDSLIWILYGVEELPYFAPETVFINFYVPLWRKKLQVPTEFNKRKVKCTIIQALRLCTGCTAHRGSRDIALLFLDHGTKRGWGVSVTPRPLFTPWKNPVPIVQEAGWTPGPVWTSAEKLAPTGIRFPDRPACSKSLYRLQI